MSKHRTVNPPTGEYPATFKIRVCKECLYPVGLISESGEFPFVCLLRYHRMEIEKTTTVDSNLTSKLPKLVTSRKGMEEERMNLVNRESHRI